MTSIHWPVSSKNVCHQRHATRNLLIWSGNDSIRNSWTWETQTFRWKTEILMLLFVSFLFHCDSSSGKFVREVRKGSLSEKEKKQFYIHILSIEGESVLNCFCLQNNGDEGNKEQREGEPHSLSFSRLCYCSMLLFYVTVLSNCSTSSLKLLLKRDSFSASVNQQEFSLQ